MKHGRTPTCSVIMSWRGVFLKFYVEGHPLHPLDLFIAGLRSTSVATVQQRAYSHAFVQALEQTSGPSPVRISCQIRMALKSFRSTSVELRCHGGRWY